MGMFDTLYVDKNSAKWPVLQHWLINIIETEVLENEKEAGKRKIYMIDCLLRHWTGSSKKKRLKD